MSMNKVRLRIYGSDYFLTTDDDVQYMRNLGDEVDFVLDRPFIFVVTGGGGLPLFAGVVNQP